MRKLFTFALTCLSLTTLAPIAAETINGVEYSTKEDGRDWKIGREFKKGNNTTSIYILDNENMDNWTESFGVYSSDILTGSNENFHKFFPSLMQSFFPGKKINYQIIHIEPQDILAEWWTEGKSSDNQHGWIRLIKTDKGNVALQYTTKKLNQLERAKTIWQPILQNATLVE